MPTIDIFPYPVPIPAKMCSVPIRSRSVMLGYAERGKITLIAVKLFFKHSNI